MLTAILASAVALWSSQGHPKEKSEFKVAGIVANGPTPIRKPVIDKSGVPVIGDDGMGAFVAENQGFVVAIDIKHAVEMIDANPIGFTLPPEEGE